MDNNSNVSTTVQASDMQRRDKIAQTYLGQHGSPGTIEKVRRRIDWMAQQACGERVLDIGCSEGILPILLAREGFTVVGIDLSPASIAHAKNLVAAEAPPVSARLHFRVCDAVTFAADHALREEGGRTTAFDTVMLGEVLEHLNLPDQMVSVAASLLRQSGRLVLTTPLGYLPHPDHRQDFTLSELRRILFESFSCCHLSIVDGYIRFVGERKQIQDERLVGSQMSTDRLLALTEAALLETQRQLRGEIADLTDRFKAARRAAEAAHQDLKSARSQAADLKRIAASREEELHTLKMAMQERLASKQEELHTLNTAVKEMRLGRDAARSTADKLRRKLHRSPRKKLGKLAKRTISRVRFVFGNSLQKVGVSPDQRPGRNGLKVAELSTSSPQHQAGQGEGKESVRAHFVPITPASAISSRPVRPSHGLVVASIMDEMSYACFAPECRLVDFTPNNWRQTLEADPPELLLVESAWRGGRGSWQYKVGKYATPRGEELVELVGWCRARGVPTVFWNKEDPIHFGRFLDAARLFDFVFTSDAESVPNYNRNGIASAATLMFAAQPLLHHPIQPDSRLLAPCFAGSYYANRHNDRRRQMDVLLEAARPFGLVIYDRNYTSEAKDFQWPDSLRAHILGGIPYDQMADVYRKYAVFLNVNSVAGSSTMLSRRVVELLGCGTAIVSTYSAAIERLFGETVQMVETAAEAELAIRKAVEDTEYRRCVVRNGLRQVMLTHTYEHRLHEILGHVGLAGGRRPGPRFAVAAILEDEEQARRAVEQIKNQTTQPQAILAAVPDDRKSTVVTEIVAQGLPGVRVIASAIGDDRGLPAPALASLGESWLAVLDPQVRLGPHHFEDLSAATVYSKADMIGSGDSYRYVQMTSPVGALLKIDLVARFGWPSGPEWCRPLLDHGVTFSIIDAEVFPAL